MQDTDSWTADQDQQLTAQQCEKKGKPNLILTSLGRILLFPLGGKNLLQRMNYHSEIVQT